MAQLYEVSYVQFPSSSKDLKVSRSKPAPSLYSPYGLSFYRIPYLTWNLTKPTKKKTRKFFFSEVENCFYVTTSQRNKTLKTALQSHSFDPDLELSDYHKMSQQSINM
jgi:hypothetical protein